MTPTVSGSSLCVHAGDRRQSVHGNAEKCFSSPANGFGESSLNPRPSPWFKITCIIMFVRGSIRAMIEKE